MKCHRGPLTCVDSSDKRPHKRKMVMRFDIWNIRSLYRTGSLKTVVKELSKYELDLVGVQEVRWDRGGTELTGNFMFVYGIENENHELGTGFFVHKRIISALKRVLFVSDDITHNTKKSLV
jgi:hypothetical protein